MEIDYQNEDLDCSCDSLWDEITEESSPNSIKKYLSPGIQKGNVLLNNKGKIKDIQNFKFELEEYSKNQEIFKSAWIPVSFEVDKYS